MMKPPYEITSQILTLISKIFEKIGEVNANFLDKQSPTLRKQNKIKTIHSSLQIEGNTLSVEQMTAILENKRVIGPQRDITEVLNANTVYEAMGNLNFASEKDFLKAHQILMMNLIDDNGKYRDKGVGIMKGDSIAHLAPPAENVPFLMKDLFHYLKNDKEIELIKSCVFHYEMEFIHPFSDGNGRMGRLWQTIILMKKYSIFEFLPFESLISKNQNEYYNALSISDKQGKSTAFIEYMLNIIDSSLEELATYRYKKFTDVERLDYFLTQRFNEFTRKDYMKIFKDISTATASRDLKKGVDVGLFEKSGDKKITRYKPI